jgi:hypothetical protein
MFQITSQEAVYDVFPLAAVIPQHLVSLTGARNSPYIEALEMRLNISETIAWLYIEDCSVL